jgi:hypothetical protein
MAAIALLESTRPVIEDTVVVDCVQHQSFPDDSVRMIFSGEFHNKGGSWFPSPFLGQPSYMSYLRSFVEYCVLGLNLLDGSLLIVSIN